MKLASPYRRALRAVEVIKSAKNLAKLILSNEDLILPHKKRILSEVLCFLSEVDGKYAARYRSKEVVRFSYRRTFINSPNPARACEPTSSRF